MHPPLRFSTPSSTRTDPATGQLVRDPFLNNTIPTNRISPIGRALLDLLPPPTFTDRLANNYLANPVKTLDDYQADVRIDHNMSGNDRIFGRFSLENAEQYLPTGLPDFGAPGAFASNQTFKTRARNIALSHTHVFGNNLINQFTAGLQPDLQLHHLVRVRVRTSPQNWASRAPTWGRTRRRR